MHVVLIVPACLSALSGASTYDRRMADGLRALGHQVQVMELPGRYPDPDKTAIDAAHSAWAELQGDSLAVIEGLALPAFAGLAAALAPRHTSVLVHHPAALETGWDAATCQRLHALESALFQAAPRLIVTSEQTADRLVGGFGADRNRIAVIAPGIEDPPRSTGSLASNPCEILSVGALIPRKGHDVLLRALSRLFDLDWHLTIVGTSDLNPVHAHGLQALAEQLQIVQHVRLINPTDPTAIEAPLAIEALWQGADLFALASWMEGYGSAMAEALRRGLPVAVTATGAAATLVGPEAGVVCAPGDAEQLSKAIRRLIFDRDLRLEMAEVAWQSARSLPSWHEQAVRLAAVLSD